MNQDKWSPLLIDDEPDSIATVEPLIREAMVKRQAAIWDVSRQLQNIPYAGTGTKQELIELEENMREMVESGLHGYKYIENFLLSLGYGLNKIRNAFRKLTGVEPEVYLDTQAYLDTPAALPGINYGWGESKDKEFDYYFIMPYAAAWAIFGQKGDLVREEVKRTATFTEAREALEKKVKEIKMYDKVIEPQKVKVKDYQDLSEHWPMGTKVAELSNYLHRIKYSSQPTEMRAVLEDAISKGQITEQEFQKLAMECGLFRSADEMTELEKQVLAKPIEEELNETTPQQFFEKGKPAQNGMVMGDVVESIVSYIDEVQKDLAEFDTTVRSFKYVSQEKSALVEGTPTVGNNKPDEFFNSTGIVSVLLDITDKTLPTNIRTKPGLAVFTIQNGNVVTSGSFKGEDDQLYPLSEEGFVKYFTNERQSIED